MYTRPASNESEFSLDDLLAQCATNLTEKASAADLGRAYERDNEVDQILASLASPLKGRIVVTGGPRVGKTAIIHEIAFRLHQNDCPEGLVGSQLWGLSARSILRAFGVRGWQDKLGQLMELWVERPEITLYVDALPSIRLAGATSEDPFDMAQFLLGQLQSTSNRILAEGRSQAVQNFLEIYPEYKHILLEIKVTEPDLESTHRIVSQVAKQLASSQELDIDTLAVEAAIDLTRRFSLSENLPGKAIDLVLEGIALISERKGTSQLSEDGIISRYAEKTGLPLMLLTDDEPYNEDIVRRQFNDQVLGQEQAVNAVVQSLTLLRTRLNSPNRPMGVFLFMGPTGVGKTELARVLAHFLFGTDEVIVRFNMADYVADWHTQTLFGNPHGYDLETRRGLFTMRLQDHAFSVILLDEFEKAHQDVYQRFLQLFDEGILINGASETVNLRNSIVILTSNFGSQLLTAGKLGFGPQSTLDEHEQNIRNQLNEFFSPELVNRLDSVCFFRPLSKSTLREIAFRRVQEILEREGLIRREVDVKVDDDVIEWVVEQGYSERYGARYLARQIEKTITYPLAQQLIRNDPPAGAYLQLFVHNGRVASSLSMPTTDHAADSPAGDAVASNPESTTIDLGELRSALAQLKSQIEGLQEAEQTADDRKALSKIQHEVSSPQFWDEPDQIEERLGELERLSERIERVDRLRRINSELEHLLAEDSLTDARQRERASRLYQLLKFELAEST